MLNAEWGCRAQDPLLGRVLVGAAGMGCSEEAVDIAAALCVQSVWVGGRGRQKEVDEAKLTFAVAEVSRGGGERPTHQRGSLKILTCTRLVWLVVSWMGWGLRATC